MTEAVLKNQKHSWFSGWQSYPFFLHIKCIAHTPKTEWRHWGLRLFLYWWKVTILDSDKSLRIMLILTIKHLGCLNRLHLEQTFLCFCWPTITKNSLWFKNLKNHKKNPNFTPKSNNKKNSLPKIIPTFKNKQLKRNIKQLEIFLESKYKCKTDTGVWSLNVSPVVKFQNFERLLPAFLFF